MGSFIPSKHPATALLAGLVLLGGAGSQAAAQASADGYLSRRVEVLIYSGTPQFEQTSRGATVQRELSLFEGYLWRYSLRHLSVDTHASYLDRPLEKDEFRDYGEQYGYLLDRSPKVDADLKALGIVPDSLILLYVPPPDRPARLAGRTFYEGSHSSIPLKEIYFEEDGFFRPLHLVMAHEFLHQIDLEFARLKLPSEFLDPDGAGASNYPTCIDPGGGDLSLRTLLQFNRLCQPVRWELLAPVYGAWIPR
jgi:hypothetical protein